MKPNIVFYFSDQQRADTLTPEIMPNLNALAQDGVNFLNAFTCQPVCGPARACLQTGVCATANGSFRNAIPLNNKIKPLAEYFNEAGYETAYVGKWHLASDFLPKVGFHCETTAVPRERRGGYKDFWRAADVLEFTSHGYDGFVFGDSGERIDFKGYRADCINDFALEYLDKKVSDKPFFLFISQLEPHHQNDRGCVEAPIGADEKWRSSPVPPDLAFLKGDYEKELPPYLAAIAALDENLGRLIAKLKEKNLFDNTVIVYTSDHGSHFKTRNLEYKRSCHDSCTHVPLVIAGGAFRGGARDERLVSLLDLPPTLLSLAGISIPTEYQGLSLTGDKRSKNVFMQISESQLGRAIRTDSYKYSVRAIGDGWTHSSSRIYFEDYLYDLQKDSIEKNNLIRDPAYAEVRRELKTQLLSEMAAAGEKKPLILPAVRVRKK